MTGSPTTSTIIRRFTDQFAIVCGRSPDKNGSINVSRLRGKSCARALKGMPRESI